MSNLKYIILLLLLSFFSFCLASESRFKIQNYSVDDGLPQRIVSDILQDEKGFLWFSTWNGLCRFDGYSFLNFKISVNKSNFLQNNRINSIKENSEGNIWCYTNSYRAYLFDISKNEYIDILQPVERKMKQYHQVRSIIPLKKGISWIITKQGSAFRVKDNSKENNPDITYYSSFDNILKGDSIYTVFEDKEGDEWILTNGGISIIGKKKIHNDTPFSKYSRQGNNMLLSTNDGIMSIYQFDTHKLTYLITPENLKEVQSIISIDNSSYAISTNAGLFTYNSRNNVFKHIRIDGVTNLSHIDWMYHGVNDYLWIFILKSTIIRVNLKTGDIQKIPNQNGISKSPMVSIFEDINNTLWTISSDGFLVYYDAIANTFRKVINSYEGFKFEENWFRGIFFVDKQKNLWIPTINGISKISFIKNNIRYTEFDKNYETRSFNIDSEEHLWAGTKSGVVRIYDDNKTLIGYLSPNGDIIKSKVTFAESGIYCIFEDNKKSIWIGTKGKGLFRLTRRADKQYRFVVNNYRHKESDDYSISSDEIYHIYQDKRQRIWIGCFKNGLNLVEEKDNNNIKFINYNNSLKSYPISEFGSIRCINETADGTILLGTTNGLLTFSSQFTDLKNIRFFKNKNNPEDAQSLIGNDIINILHNKRNETYVTTVEGAINKVIDNNMLTDHIRFKALDIEQSSRIPGLFQSVTEDKEHNIWIISEDAITRYNPQNNEFNIFKRNSLVQTNFYSEASSVFDHRGHLIVGTEGGMIEVDPRLILKDQYVPPIAFTEINVQGTNIDGLNSIQELNLTASQRNLSIHFATLDYVNSQEINYAYRLIGLDTEWNYTGKNRSVSYVNLPKGHYKFQVRSTNSNGIWIDNIKELPINIKPKFSETAYFWILLSFIILAITLLITYIALYIYRLQYRVTLEKHLTEIKIRFFTDISHELRTPLTLISGPVNEVLENEQISSKARAYLSIVNNNVTRMIRLINEILDFRKVQSNKMKLLVENSDLVIEIKRIMSEFFLIQEEKQMNFSLECNSEHVYCWIDRDKFEKVLFNLISNAFKFTPSKGTIRINLISEKDLIAIIISDNGIGISPQKINTLFERFESYTLYNPLQPSSGIGLALAKELLTLHHATIEVKSRKDEGSEFKIELLKGKSHFINDNNIEFILNDSLSNELQENILTNSDEEYNEDTLSILIVEDNKELAGFLSSILSIEYQTILAVNGQEGLILAEEKIPDFIITDIMMPEMDGLDMIKAIKENRDICHIPIIVLSARSTLDDRIEGLEYGIDDYITKPFSSTYLKKKIKAVINQRKQLQEIFMTDIAKNDEVQNSIILSQPQIINSDKVFIQQLIQYMEDNINNSDFKIESIAEAMKISRSIFYRKVKSILGLSPIDLIRKIRIKRAIQLINSGEYNFSEVAYMTGFSDPKYFGKCFKKETGLNPSEFKKKEVEPEQ